MDLLLLVEGTLRLRWLYVSELVGRAVRGGEEFRTQFSILDDGIFYSGWMFCQ
jgi:hypothetical protein